MFFQNIEGPTEGVNRHVTEKSSNLDPRESMRVLPSVCQGFLTSITGKPFQGQAARTLTPQYHLIVALFVLSLGLILSFAAVEYGNGWILLLLPGWMLTLYSMRNMRMMLYHQCSHENMFGHKQLDTLLGEAIATVLVVQNFHEYKQEHISEHHSMHHMTLSDPTVKALLLGLGLRPGMTRRQLWSRLLKMLISPTFHFRFLLARVRSHFQPASTIRKVVSVSFLVALALLVTVTNSWLPFLIAWVLPLTLFFQVSNTLRLCVKHTFPRPGVTKRGKEYFASLTYGIFLGERVPDRSLSNMCKLWAWLGWFARMTFIHFPSRTLVLTGDTVCHDFHHRHPRTKDWANYIFAREDDIRSGHHGWPAYQEIWTLRAAINTVFDSLSNADSDEFDVNKIMIDTSCESFTAFDD